MAELPVSDDAAHRLAAAVENLGDAARAHVNGERARERRARLATPETDAALAAANRPLRKPLVGLLRKVMHAAPRPGAFVTAIPRARWAIDSTGTRARMSCACGGEDLDVDRGQITVCECGRSFLLLAADIFVDYPRPSADRPSPLVD